MPRSLRARNMPRGAPKNSAVATARTQESCAKIPAGGPDYATYRISGTAASVRLALPTQVTTSAGASALSVAASVSYGREDGAWKPDGLDAFPWGN